MDKGVHGLALNSLSFSKVIVETNTEVNDYEFMF